MDSRRKAKLFGLSELLLGLLLMIMIIMLGNRYLSSVRLDMTEHSIYTVSQGTQNILKRLSQPIKLKLFYSKKLSPALPGIGVYADQVTDMLREYQRIAGNNLQLEFVDPEPFSQAEDLAVANGLNAVTIDQQGTGFYFGLVATNSIDGRETIAFFNPERDQQLEYDLTRLIQRLSDDSHTQIAVLSALSVSGDPQAALYGMQGNPWFSIDQLRELYPLSYLDSGVDTIDSSISVLLVIHPSSLPEQALFAIDQFALNGGKVIMFVDPLAESEPTNNPGLNPETPGAQNQDQVNAMLKAWGVRFDTQKLVLDLDNAMRVQSAVSARGIVTDYPVWFSVSQQAMNADEPVLENLGEVIMASVGSLAQADQSTTQFMPLMKSSETASQINKERIQFVQDPKEILKLYQPGSNALTLAARVSGDVETAFPDYQPGSADDETEQSQSSSADDVPSSDNGNDEDDAVDEQQTSAAGQLNAGSINVVVFADTDFLRDQFWVQIQNFLGDQLAVPSAGNGKLVANLVDQMSGSADLISVRNRGSANRPFTLLDSIRQDAEQRFLKKEQELISELQTTESKLIELEQAKNTQNITLLSTDQQAEIDSFTQKKLSIRKQLRQVRHSLQKDIEKVETTVKVVNIALVPFLIVLFGLGVLFFKSIRARKNG